ncbi:MAG: hypothetical protein ACRECR_00900, partial [Thermoplasmata archaeon]
MFEIGTLGPFAPEILLLGATLLIFVLDRAGGDRIELFGAVALAGLFGAGLIVLADLDLGPLAALRGIGPGAIDHPVVAGSLYGFSSLGLVFQGIFLLAAILVALASLSRPAREPGASVFYGLLLLATLGMMLVAVATDLIFLL